MFHSLLLKRVLETGRQKAGVRGAWERSVRVATVVVFAFSVPLFALVAGGLAVQALTGDIHVSRPLLRIFIAVTSLGAAFWTGVRLFRTGGRRFLLKASLAAGSALLALYAANLAVVPFVPAWPLRDLHGSPPADFYAVINHAHLSDFNSWGQKDRERALAPAPGVRRIALIGDSFLEASPRPLSVLIEENMDDPGVEVVNLGVQATSPDEYFYRLKNVGVPIGVTEAVVLFYPGNDFITRSSLRSFWGVAAVSPRDSLLSFLGLHGINHLIMNRYRPFSGRHDSTHFHEREIQEQIREGDEPDLKELFLSFVKPDYRESLDARLDGRLADLASFLKHPDEGIFRSFAVEAALRFAAGQDKRSAVIDETGAYKELRRMVDFCRREGIRLSVAFVPLAPEADDRLQDAMGDLVDVRRMIRRRVQARDRLMARLEADGVRVIDLAEPLSRRSGNYLNLDWHWSEKGVSAVATHLAGILRRTPGDRPSR